MEKRNKVILISCDSPRSLLDFRGKLMDALLVDHEVHVFTPPITQGPIALQLKSMGVITHENQLQPSTVHVTSDLKYISDLYRLLRKLKPDIFFPYTFKPVIYGTVVARICGVRTIAPMLTGLGYNFSEHTDRVTPLQRVVRLLLKISLLPHGNLRLILQNNDDCANLRQHNIITAKTKVHVVNGSGVDLDHYHYSEPDPGKVRFLMVSRLIKAKGVEEYYHAARVVKASFPDTRFTLIGAYEENVDTIDAELYQRILSDGVLDYVGLVTDVRPYIKDASVVVLPSYYGEGVPRCLLEAMAMGRAIITCDSVGCRETVNLHKKQTNGFLVPRKDAQQLASRMEYYINNKSDISRFGRNGRKYAAEKFDVHEINKVMVNILSGTTQD